jgi:toxin FitB
VIVVDTNVISELMRPAPDAKVLAWFAAQPSEQLYTTHINQIEILYGIAILPEGRRRNGLTAAAEAMFAEDLAGRILPFGASAAACYAGVMMSRRKAGKPIEGLDALIAAISLAAGAAVATRDIGGFSDCGLDVVNPWSDP